MPILHEEKTVDAKICQTIYMSLLMMMEKSPDTIPASQYVRELLQTKRCDKEGFGKNLQVLRHDYITAIEQGSSGVIKRIEDFKETEEDEKRCVNATVHYSFWTQENLLQALSWRNWLYYHTIIKAERIFASNTKNQ